MHACMLAVAVAGIMGLFGGRPGGVGEGGEAPGTALLSPQKAGGGGGGGAFSPPPPPCPPFSYVAGRLPRPHGRARFDGRGVREEGAGAGRRPGALTASLHTAHTHTHTIEQYPFVVRVNEGMLKHALKYS